MKNLIAVLGIMTFTFALNAQVSMSINAGMKYQKATFGYKIGKIQPYLGFGVLSYGATLESVDYDGEKYTSEGSLRVIMPNFGVKVDLVNKGSLKGGIDLGFYKPFLSGTSKFDGREEKEFSENLKNIKIFGGELGVFSEYYFSEQFSIGGSFGLRLAKSSYDSSGVNNEPYFDKIKVNLGMTYTMFSANFYF